MPEIKIAKQDTLLAAKALADGNKTSVNSLLTKPAGFHFFHEVKPMSMDELRWFSVPDAPRAFRFASAATSFIYTGEYFIYLFGNNLNTSAETFRFSTFTGEWQQMADCPESLHQSIAVSNYNGIIMVLIGSSGMSKSCYFYYPDSDSWTQIQDEPYYSQGAVAGRIGYMIYVAGGPMTTTAFRAYDISAILGNPWITTLPDLPEAINAAMGGVVNNAFYVLGAGTGFFMKYSPNSWTMLPSPPETIYKCAHGVFGNKLIFAGGVNASPNRWWSYDTVSNTWSVLTETGGAYAYGTGAISPNNDEFYAFSFTASKMKKLYTILGSQAHGYVKKGQKVYWYKYGPNGTVTVAGNTINSGQTAPEDGLLESSFYDGFGVIRGWVK